MEISELGEFGLIDRLAKDITTKNESTIKGIASVASATIVPSLRLRKECELWSRPTF